MSRFTPVKRQGIYYAPMTLGAPCNTVHVDHSVFKKSPQEIAEVATHKKALGKSKHHKFSTLVKATF